MLGTYIWKVIVVITSEGKERQLHKLTMRGLAVVAAANPCILTSTPRVARGVSTTATANRSERVLFA